MPLLEVTNGPTPPSGMTLTRNTSLVVEFDRAYSDGSDVYPMVYRAEYDPSTGGWKPEGADDGEEFALPGARAGDPVPPRVVFTELQTYLEGESTISRRELPGIVSNSSTWDYASLPLSYKVITVGDISTEDAASILALLVTVDGPASGLNADLLDGNHASYFATASGLSSHVAAADPHPQYLTQAEGDSLYSGGGGGTAEMNIAGLLTVPGAIVKVVNVGGSWQLPDGTTVNSTLFANREASVVWEGTTSQIPAQGTGAMDFRLGDEARVRSDEL